jgi:hypothetical protein
MENSENMPKGRMERILPFLLSLIVLLASFFFLMGGMVIPSIASYY